MPRIAIFILPSDRLIEVVQAYGNDARDLRDAAHEAYHALSAGCPRPWDRESIHRAVMSLGRGEAAANEIMARAVEQIVCHDLGVECWSIEDTAALSCIESIRSGIGYPSASWFADRVRDYMRSKEARKAANRILALI